MTSTLRQAQGERYVPALTNSHDLHTPEPGTYYIGSLYLRPSWQGDGYGHELIQELEHQLQRGGYAAGRVAVGLKNWPALRFWTKQGYDTVTMISGDRTYAADHYAVIELQKNLGTGTEEYPKE